MRSPTWPSTWRRRRADRLPLPDGGLALGSGRPSRAGVAPKAARLDRAAAAGLPVPPGFVLPDGLDPGPTFVARTEAWATTVGTSRLAVRSAFGAEDSAGDSLAGWFSTRLGVAPSDVAAAVADVRRSADAREGVFRRDVLVMAMVEAQQAGVAFSEPGTYDDVVNVADGTADRLLAGGEPGRRLELPRLERISLPGWERRLQDLLRRVRAVFGDAPWDVEWADDGDRCRLLQLRPITVRPLRDELLTIANHAEILPAMPSRLMTSMIAEAGPQLFGWYRRRDLTLPADRAFLHVVAGRPFINLSLLEDMLRHLGLPTGLVARSIGGTSGSDRPARPGRMARKAPVLLRLGLAQAGAVARARSIERRASRHGRQPMPDLTTALARLTDAYVELVTGMFPLSSAIGPPLAVLRRLGTLEEHARTHRTVTTELAERLAAARASGDPAELDRFLARFGHRGVYESDIARPRYRDDPAILSAPRTPAAGLRGAGGPRSMRARATLPLWLVTRAPLAARERLRDAAMHSFADIRDALLALAGDAAGRGQLRAPDDLWMLDVDEVRRLDGGWVPDARFWTDRQAEIDRLAALDPPPLVRRFEDPSRWASPTVADGGVLSGLPLTEGVVKGRAWVVAEPSTDLPTGFDPATTVLVTRSIDAGWIPTLALVAAVVVDVGGDLSHGSILLREQGIPAITNVGGATRALTTGDAVEVRARTGTVQLVEERTEQPGSDRAEDARGVSRA